MSFPKGSKLPPNKQIKVKKIANKLNFIVYSSKNLLQTVQIKGVTVEKIPRNIIKAKMDP